METAFIDVAVPALGEFLALLPPSVKIVGTGPFPHNYSAGGVCRFILDVSATGRAGGRWTAEISVTPFSKTATFGPEGK